MSDYQFRYLKGLENGKAKSGALIERTDEVLADLFDEKGEFYTQVAEFMLKIRMGNAINEQRVLVQNTSKSASKFVLYLLRREFGVKASDKLDELVNDVDRMTNYILGV